VTFRMIYISDRLAYYQLALQVGEITCQSVWCFVLLFLYWINMRALMVFGGTFNNISVISWRQFY